VTSVVGLPTDVIEWSTTSVS